MNTKPDPSAVRLQIARRFARDMQFDEKLRLLRRLQRRHVECNLPREAETRVEQSFNEQLFAKVLGYRTLLSHDQLPYHLRAKNHARGAGRFDDFSLGLFWGDERDKVVASAEFKSPGALLDAPQTDRRDRSTPVEQAFRAAAGMPKGCEWVIVSNFSELRLYRLGEPTLPIFVVDLHEIRSRRQLAALCAHLDFEALIGSGRSSDMAVMLDPNHLSAPIPAAENGYRLICTFTPNANTAEFRPSEVYDALRSSASKFLAKKNRLGQPSATVQIEDAWCATKVDSMHLAMSTEGLVQFSLWRDNTSGAAQVHANIEFWQLANDVHNFLKIITHIFPRASRPTSGMVSVTIREIKNWQMYFNAAAIINKDDDTNAGVAETEAAFSGDLRWEVGQDPDMLAALIMSELAVMFVGEDRDRVRLDIKGLAAHLKASS